MRTVKYHVDALGFIINCKAGGIIVAQAHSRNDIDTVGFVPIDCYWSHICNRQSVVSAFVRSPEQSGRRLVQVVAIARLIVDSSNPAECAGTKIVLSSRVSIDALITLSGRQQTYVQCLAV